MIDWRIDGVTFGNCNCDYGCPCQFEVVPTHGHCQGMEVGEIARGHFGDVRLDDLRWALLYAWPGPIYEGKGLMQAVIDKRADSRQREALRAILHGEETEEAKTHWWVFHAMSNTVHEPLFAEIDFEVEMEARRARVRIPGVLEATGRPIVSPVTGEEHRVRIDIPNGIEFRFAEVGSASTRADGPIELNLEDTYGQFNVVHTTGRGIVEPAEVPS